MKTITSIYTCSYSDKMLYKKIGENVLSLYKKGTSQKRIPAKLVITLESVLKNSLDKKFAHVSFKHTFRNSYIAYFYIYVFYNKCKVLIQVYNQYCKKSEVSEPEYDFENKKFAASANYDKYLLFSAKVIEKMLKSAYPEFKFPDPNSNVKLYENIWTFNDKEKELVKEFLRDSFYKCGNNLYLALNNLFIVSNKNDCVYFIYREHSNVNFSKYLYASMHIISNMIQFIGEFLGVDTEFLRQNLDDENIVETLKKHKLLASL